MTIEERYLNCFLAMQRAQNPNFKKIWFNKMKYFESKMRDVKIHDESAAYYHYFREFTQK